MKSGIETSLTLQLAQAALGGVGRVADHRAAADWPRLACDRHAKQLGPLPGEVEKRVRERADLRLRVASPIESTLEASAKPSRMSMPEE